MALATSFWDAVILAQPGCVLEAMMESTSQANLSAIPRVRVLVPTPKQGNWN